MPQMPLGAKAFEVPTSNTAAQSQYQMMALETEQGPIHVPINVQAASKVADEHRKRNATASHRFRQRRKEKEREISEKIAKLEAQVRETAEERDHYLKERDHFRDVALRQGADGMPRRADHHLHNIKKLRVVSEEAGKPDEARVPTSHLKASYHRPWSLLHQCLHLNA